MDDDSNGLPKEVRSALVLIAAAVIIAAVMLAVNFQISRSIVDQAEQFRKDMANERRGQHTGPPPPDRIPGPVAHLSGSGDVDGARPAAQADGMEVAAAPVVSPGDESARPPHRGRIDEP